MKSYALVPGSATASSADLWIAVMSLNERPVPPPAAFLLNEATNTSLAITGWREWLLPDRSAGVVYARLSLDGLAPRVRQRVRLVIDNQPKAAAWIATLPDRLPSLEERPFTLMLGSCFCSAEDKAGRAGKAFTMLPAGLHPDLKILCGDQVYLDAPFYRFLLPHEPQALAEIFLRNYVTTWTQTGDLEGYQQILSDGPALLTSDDHEFWNNAPFPSFSVDTWTSGGRQAWTQLASELFGVFQMFEGGSTVRQVAVGELSILVTDTRVNRHKDHEQLLTPEDLQRVLDWIRGLTFPGILVIGQPVFARQAGIKGNIADWNLPDFKQYAALCRALLAAPQPIIVLTGDVHFGRVARVVTHDSIEIVEIIASPMRLVTAGGKREWSAAPDKFPADPIAGTVSLPVETVSTWKRALDHFLIIELWQSGGRLQLRATTREFDAGTGTPSQPVYSQAFQRMR